MTHSSAREDDIENTVLTYRDSLLRLAYAYLKNHSDAEDVAQEVFVAYILKMPRCKTEAKKKSWLMTVTANKCRNHLNSAWKKRRTTMPDDLSFMPEDEADVLSCVLSLDEKYRIPIHLYYYEGYSIKEISMLLRSNDATVGTWLSRGRALLKTMIGDDLHEQFVSEIYAADKV